MQMTSFGTLPTGEHIERHTLSNATGTRLSVITYGGLISELLVPDSHGQARDVILGYQTLDDYAASSLFLGTITGRVAGRITGGRFTLGGREYQLEINNPPNHIHGGSHGFDRRIWTAEQARNEFGQEILRISYRSPDGEAGYPGNLNCTVVYTLTDENEVIINYHAESDKITPINLTNHSYFNLAGEGSGTIDDHVLQINAADYVPSADDMTLLGRLDPVTPANDFRQPRRIGDALPGLHKQHGDTYLATCRTKSGLELIAQVSEPHSGLTMEVLSTKRFLQFYTGQFLDGSVTGKSGRPYHARAGLCLECQGYPDGVNHPQLDDILLHPGESYEQTTVYRFTSR